MSDPTPPQVESLLPYDDWTEAAMRQVMVRALAHVAAEGLPGEHHFYITFRTDHPGVAIPARLRAQYATEMTIVLQHQFWDLKLDEAAGVLSVGLSFGGVSTTLVIPLAAITGFADPFVRFGLRFRGEPADVAAEAEAEAEPAPEPPPEPPPPEPQVVSLDAFRRRSTPKS